MKTLDVQARLEYARAGVAVVRALRTAKATMRYKEFGEAIGLIPEGGDWEPWYRQQIRDVLNIIAAVTNQPGCAKIELDFERIVTEDGEPGAGFYKTSRIVSE
jgi:hypothetical protein